LSCESIVNSWTAPFGTPSLTVSSEASAYGGAIEKSPSGRSLLAASFGASAARARPKADARQRRAATHASRVRIFILSFRKRGDGLRAVPFVRFRVIAAGRPTEYSVRRIRSGGRPREPSGAYPRNEFWRPPAARSPTWSGRGRRRPGGGRWNV